MFEYIVTVPDYPGRVEGKAGLVELYRGYGDTFSSRGRAVRTGARYANHYISVITIVDRKITHWRDYLNPLAVLTALAADS